MARRIDNRPVCRICHKRIADGEARWSEVTLIGDEYWTHDSCERKKK